MALRSTIFVALLYLAVARDCKKKPNIIFMLADDFGWNDIGFHNQAMITPVLDRLAADGIILNQSYTQNMCTPSRAALLTGYYPFKTGMQALVLSSFGAAGLPLQFELLPAKLKRLGYRTHIIGKWHLGSCAKAYAPTSRGFDTAFGYNMGGQFYYDHSGPLLGPADSVAQEGVINVYDFWNQSAVAWNYRGTHSSTPFNRQVKYILQNHNPDDPLFMYLPFQLTHSPLEVPADKLLLYPNEANKARKTFSAMASQLDSDVGYIISQLKRYGLYDNCIIIFTGDNGGEVRAGGNNYPLRGAKHTIWEGGHRAAAFIHSPLLTDKGYTYNGLVHIVDWYPTLLGLAGGRADEKLDGVNVWAAITKNRASPRKEIIYHLENDGPEIGGAVRIGDWKLLIGKAGLPNNAVPPSDVQGLYEKVVGGNVFYDDIANYPAFRLFNLKNDPYENVNLASVRLDKVYELLGRALELKREMVQPLALPNDIVLYKAENDNLTYLGRNWCVATRKVTPIDWSEL